METTFIMRSAAMGKGELAILHFYWLLAKTLSRFAIETPMGSPSSESEGRRSPFMTLAGYIGVRGTPQNEGAKTIAMTAPVAMKQSDEVSEVFVLTLCRSQSLTIW